MEYGKLNCGVLINAPKTITKDGRVHYHPSDELYIEFGYLPVVRTPYPETNEEEHIMYESTWVEQDGEIVQVWKEAAVRDIPQAPSKADRVLAIEANQARLDEQLRNTMAALDDIIMGREV